MIRTSPSFMLAAVMLGCSEPRILHEDVAGCYALDWQTADDTAHLSLNPDSVLLSVEQYWPPAEVLERTDAPEFRKAKLGRHPRVVYRNEHADVPWVDVDAWWWWRIEGDSVMFATGHDAADLMGFRAAVDRGGLSGVGVWENDYGPGAAFSVTGTRISCPEHLR
jgi:hypothetical protein